MTTFDEAVSESKAYFSGDDLAANVFVTKYALCDKADGDRCMGIIHNQKLYLTKKEKYYSSMP